MRWSGTPLDQLKGRRIARLRAFIPQRAPVPAGVTVREAVELGRSPHIKPLGRPTRHDREAVDRALTRTNVFEFAARRAGSQAARKATIEISSTMAPNMPSTPQMAVPKYDGIMRRIA